MKLRTNQTIAEKQLEERRQETWKKQSTRKCLYPGWAAVKTKYWHGYAAATTTAKHNAAANACYDRCF